MSQTSPSWHLAQVNIARARARIDSPLMAGFVAQLERVNAVADASPGFVWRLQADTGDALAIRMSDGDPRMLVNLSTWESLQALTAYVYRSAHSEPMRRRSEWFERLKVPTVALWWVPAGHRPAAREGEHRLEQVATHGPSPAAFTFARPFPHPGTVARPVARSPRETDHHTVHRVHRAHGPQKPGAHEESR
ncbi:MAG: DUF3291 domain-containing protein [Myxococcales bacterium]|nr:DUF3291 domain-containing protein [Myxococcales bacterium]